MRPNGLTVTLVAILALGAALPTKLWRELREVGRRELSRAAETAAVLMAAVILPACGEGFVAFGPVGDQGEAELPEWFEPEDEASMLFLREIEERRIPLNIIHGELAAGIITAREAELALARHLVASARARLETLKLPNGPAYAAWLSRRFPSDDGGVAPSTVGELIGRVESTIERDRGGSDRLSHQQTAREAEQHIELTLGSKPQGGLPVNHEVAAPGLARMELFHYGA